MDSGLALRAPRNDGGGIARSRMTMESLPLCARRNDESLASEGRRRVPEMTTRGQARRGMTMESAPWDGQPRLRFGRHDGYARCMNRNSEDIVRRATAAFNAGRPDQARRLCEQGLRHAPADPMLNHLLAAVLFAGGEIRPARAYVEASLAERPQNAAAQLLAGRIARAAQDYDAALSHLDRAISIAPQRELFLEKARTLDRAGLRHAAREAWRAIIEVVPQHQEAAARLGRLAWEDGDLAGAAMLLERAIAAAAPAPVWFDLGLVRQDLRDYGGAAAAYRKALELSPDYAEAALNLGIVVQEGGDLAGAMRAYAEAYRLRPSMFGAIAMALTSARHGQLWLDEAALRHSLGG
jgi:tetratricopeptide (TPR) repeat protein